MVDPSAQGILGLCGPLLQLAWAAFIPPCPASARSIKVDRRVMALLSRKHRGRHRGHQPHQPVRAVTHVSVVKASPLLPPKNQRKVPIPRQLPSRRPRTSHPPPGKPAPQRGPPVVPPFPTAIPAPSQQSAPRGQGHASAPAGHPTPARAFRPLPQQKKRPPSGSPFSSVLFRQEVLSWEGGEAAMFLLLPVGGDCSIHSRICSTSPHRPGPVHPEHRQGGGGQPVLHQGLRPALHHAEESFLLLVQVAAGAHPLPEPPVKTVLPHPSKPQRPGRLHQHGPAEQRLPPGGRSSLSPRRTPGPAAAPLLQEQSHRLLPGSGPGPGVPGVEFWGSTGPRCRRTSTPAAGPKPGPGCSSPRRLARRPGCPGTSYQPDGNAPPPQVLFQVRMAIS